MHCLKCNGELEQISEGRFKCNQCKAIFRMELKDSRSDTDHYGDWASFVCPTCGSREFEDLDDKIRCKCCFNTYDKTEDKLPFTNDLSQADNFRQMADFTHAKMIYKKVIEENPDADLTSAYWGIYLCDNNVVFEKDGKGNVFPSFYKVLTEKSVENEYYQRAIECSTAFHPDKTANLVALAGKIDDDRKKYWDISSKNEPFDVFICFKNDNGLSSMWAREIYNRFTRKYNVFFSEETLKYIKSLYREYEPNIYYALYTAKVMIVICKDRNEIESQWVQNEWFRFSEINKRAGMGKAIIPIFVDDFDPNNLPDSLWHTQGLKADHQLIANLEEQLKEYLSPDASGRAKGHSKEDKERMEKDLALEKELRESQHRLSELERSLKDSALSESVVKVQNLLNIMWIKIQEFGEFREAKERANEIIKMNANCSKAWLGLAYIDFYARSEAEFIKNFRYYENSNYKLAYKYATKAEQEHFDKLYEQYDINNQNAAKEVIKEDVRFIHNTLVTIKSASLMDMRSFYNRLSTTLTKIETLDTEYQKHLSKDIKEIKAIRDKVVVMIAESVSNTFIKYSKDPSIDILDYDALVNQSESFMPDESKTYFIENCYSTTKTLVESAVSTQTEKFKDIIKQADDALNESKELENKFSKYAETYKVKKTKIKVEADKSYIKRIKRRWVLCSLLFTILLVAMALIEINMPFLDGNTFLGFIIPMGFFWLVSFFEYKKHRKISHLIFSEIVCTIIYLVSLFMCGMDYAKEHILLLIVLGLMILLIAITARTIHVSPKRRHPKSSMDLTYLDEKKGASKYYSRRFMSQTNKTNAEFKVQLDSAFNAIAMLDHDLGGVVLKCRVDSVENQDELLDCLKCYQQKVAEIKRFFNLAIKQAQGVLIKIRKYGR